MPAKQINRQVVFMIGAGFLIVAVIAVVLYRRAPRSAVKSVDSFNTLKLVLEPDGWSVPRPPRTDWTPGTLLVVDRNSVTIYQRGEEAFPEEEFERREGRAPYPQMTISLDCSIDADARFLSGANQVAAGELSTSVFTITLKDAIAKYIPLKQLEDAVASSDFLKNAVSMRPPETVFVITEALSVGSIQITNSAESGTTIEEGASVQDSLEAGLRANVQSSSQSEYVVPGPITVGYKVRSLAAVAKSLGDPAAGLDIKLLPTGMGDQDKIGDLEEVAKAQESTGLRVVTPIHVLAIGLDLYAVDEKAKIGGVLPGAPASAALVAWRMTQLFGHDPRCSVDLYAPTLQQGRLRDRATSQELKSIIGQWKERVGQGDQGVPNAYMIYYCGHGVVDSANGFVVMVPEDYGETDEHGRIKSGGLSWADVNVLSDKQSACLVVLDCCRKEDGYLNHVQERARQPFRSGAQASAMRSMRRNFRSGFPGPGTFLIHATGNDTSAFTIPHTIGIARYDVGPLAAVIDTVLENGIADQSDLTFSDLADLVMRKTRVAGIEVQGKRWRNVWSDQTQQRFVKLTLFDAR